MASTSKAAHSNCVRLAESEAIAVDLRGCEAMQVHLADLSLRLPPEMVLSLMRTLSAALAKRQTFLAQRAARETLNTNWSGSDVPPGKAWAPDRRRHDTQLPFGAGAFGPASSPSLEGESSGTGNLNGAKSEPRASDTGAARARRFRS